MNVTINILELASELASYELNETWQDSIKIYDYDEDGNSFYTDEAQDIFNDLYDKYYAVIESYAIKP